MEKGFLINNSASKATKSGGILSGGSDSTSKYPSSSVADHTRLLNEDLVSSISDSGEANLPQGDGVSVAPMAGQMRPIDIKS